MESNLNLYTVVIPTPFDKKKKQVDGGQKVNYALSVIGCKQNLIFISLSQTRMLLIKKILKIVYGNNENIQ